MRKFQVNVDSGFDLDGAHFALGTTAELDENDGRVQEARNQGRLIPVEDKPKPKPAEKPETEKN